MQITDQSNAPAMEPQMRRRLVAAAATLATLAIVFAGWIFGASLSSAVIASGLVVVDSSAKKVQHLTGGIVARINVKNGDRVAAGDIVLSLDDTQARANLGLVTSQLVQLVGRKARLVAERDGVFEVRFPSGFASSDPEAPAVMIGELQLLQTRRTQRVAQQDQLRQRIDQLGKEMEGLGAQQTAKDKEIDLLRDELLRMRILSRQQLIPTSRIVTAERELAKLEGERGQLIAQIARAGAQVSETELQITSVDLTTQSEASKELREIEARINELAERRISAEDQLRRIEIRAPQSGTVHELAVHTVGGIVNAGETIMMVVPTGDALAIEVRIAPGDIDQVSIGQRAVLRFPGLSRETTPEIAAEVSRVAADLTRDTQAGAFFLARLTAAAGEQAKLNKVRLLPGMPVEGYIEGSQRTTWSYLVKPITDQIRRAMRED